MYTTNDATIAIGDMSCDVVGSGDGLKTHMSTAVSKDDSSLREATPGHDVGVQYLTTPLLSVSDITVALHVEELHHRLIAALSR